jgi:L-alanine-DL-glutamate epimerase-like enolase superfamily enzyme
MPDLIWTGGISETHKVAVLASAHQLPIAPHDATGPVNIFACAQICMSAANAMVQEHVPSFYKGWYSQIVDPNLEIRDGYLHAPQRPGIGTRLKADLRDRPDAIVRVSDSPGESAIDAWGDAPVRTPELQAEIDRLRIERGPRPEG